MEILIGADIVPTESNVKHFISGDMDNVIGDKLKKELSQADFRVFNLEVPLSDVEHPIRKCGPCHIATIECVAGLKAINTDILTLANNHIMDQGKYGLEKTMHILKQNEIDFVGAGQNIEKAKEPYIVTKDGVSVGIYACAEHEFSIAGENLPGANPFDYCDSFDHICDLKKQCDYVIVLYHGGKEHYRYPSPNLQKVCRKMCEKGADLVICQHSHCVGCKENYNGSIIIYGQGNFIFDDGNNEFVNSSILVRVMFDNDIQVEEIPLESENGFVEVSDCRSIIDNFNERSEDIIKEGFIDLKYGEFSQKMLQNYLYNICGVSIVFRIMNKLSGHRLQKKISKKRRLSLINYFECEAHRELLLKGLKLHKWQ